MKLVIQIERQFSEDHWIRASAIAYAFAICDLRQNTVPTISWLMLIIISLQIDFRSTDRAVRVHLTPAAWVRALPHRKLRNGFTRRRAISLLVLTPVAYTLRKMFISIYSSDKFYCAYNNAVIHATHATLATTTKRAPELYSFFWIFYNWYKSVIS